MTNTMKRYNIGPLQVFYGREAPPRKQVGDVIVMLPYAMSLATLKESIETGEIDRVFIVGQTACYGWRISVNREVSFFPYRGPMPDFAHESAQAESRIVSRLKPTGE